MTTRLLLALWAFGLGFSLQAQQTPFLDPIYGTVVTTNIQYGTGSVGNPASGTIPLYADLYQPVGPGLPKILPGFIFIHGGGFVSGSKSDSVIVQFCQAYAKRGYVVASIDYRLAGNNPTMEPGPTAGTTSQERAINAASQDAAKALRTLRSNSVALKIDPTRVAIGGGSAGAVTSLFTGYQEAGTIGTNAGVSVILDLWGGMFGGESLVDTNDPPVFIVHGTADTTVPVTESQSLVARLNTIGLDYRYYPIQGADHGAWTPFFTNVVNGKTIDRHCAEFFFKKLGLIEIYPGAVAPSVSANGPATTVTVSVATDPNFRYQLYSSTNLTGWNPVHTNQISGTGNPLEFVRSAAGNRGFYRWLISPGF